MVIELSIRDYTNQTSIDTYRVRKILAATLPYILDIPALSRSLAGYYNGEYRDSKSTVKALENIKCNKKIKDDL